MYSKVCDYSTHQAVFQTLKYLNLPVSTVNVFLKCLFADVLQYILYWSPKGVFLTRGIFFFSYSKNFFANESSCLLNFYLFLKNPL